MVFSSLMTDRWQPTPQQHAEASSSRSSSMFDATRLPWRAIGEPQISLEARRFRVSDTLTKTCFVGSVIGTNAALRAIYFGLTAAEQARAREKVYQIADAYLQGDLLPRRAGLLRGNNGHPDIHVVDLGRRDDPNSVHVYYLQVYGPQETFLLVSACKARQTRNVENVFPGHRQVRS